MRSTLLILATALSLILTATARADDWEAAPLFDGPGWAESLEPALDYWAQVPELSWTDDQGTHVVHPAELVASLRGPAEGRKVCPAGISYRLLTTAAGGNAWGRTSDETHADCAIWIEQGFADATEAMGPGERERVRCAAGVHELGHALGIPHGNFPDPLNIMGAWPHQLYPQPCLDRWPLPRATTPAPAAQAQAPDLAAQAYLGGAYTVITKAAAKAAVAKKLGRGWRITAETMESVDWMAVKVRVAAVRKVCIKSRCKIAKRRFLASGRHNAIVLRRVAV